MGLRAVHQCASIPSHFACLQTANPLLSYVDVRKVAEIYIIISISLSYIATNDSTASRVLPLRVCDTVDERIELTPVLSLFSVLLYCRVYIAAPVLSIIGFLYGSRMQVVWRFMPCSKQPFVTFLTDS